MLFIMKHLEVANGNQEKQIDRTFSSPQGDLVAQEKIILNGNLLYKMSLSQLQTDEQGSLEVSAGKLHFSYTRNGKTTQDSEKATDNLVVSGTLIPYLQQHWRELQAGKEVEVRYAVLDRKETVGFKFFKIQSSPEKFVTKPEMVLKMKPSSFFIAAIVDPLYFNFSQNGADLYELIGRTLPKVKVNGKWKDIDADIVFKP